MRLRSVKNWAIVVRCFLPYLDEGIIISEAVYRGRISSSQESSFRGSVISVSLCSVTRAS
jgi:hypothetical protein